MDGDEIKWMTNAILATMKFGRPDIENWKNDLCD